MPNIPAAPGAYELSRSVVVYKAVDKGIAVLRIPAGAHVVVPRSDRAPDRQKLRTDEADVLGIVSENGEQIRESPSLYYDDFLYVTGETVTSSLSYDLGVECTHGIHSFKSFQPAGYWYAGVGIDMIGSEKFAKMKQEAQEIATEAKDVV